jgi:hypothetical protein
MPNQSMQRPFIDEAARALYAKLLEVEEVFDEELDVLFTLQSKENLKKPSLGRRGL